MRKALRTAMAERPGPVHITTHADVVGAEAKDDAIAAAAAQGALALQVFAACRTIARRLRKAKKPVILAGIAAQRAGAHAALARLAEAAGIPVVVAPMAKGVLAEDHPYYAGTLDMACNAFMWDFLKGCDLLLAVGFDAVELIKPWTLSVPTVHIDAVPNTDQIYRADTELVGDIAAILDGHRCGAGKASREVEGGGGEAPPRRAARRLLRGAREGQAQSDRRDRRGARGAAARGDRHHRRRLAQAAGRARAGAPTSRARC